MNDASLSSKSTAGAPWRDLCVVLVCSLTGFSNLYSTQSLAGELARLFGLSQQRSAMLLTATTLCLAIASPLAGRLAQALGTRCTVLAGLALLAALNAGMALADGYATLLALRAAQGLAIPCVLTPLLADVARQRTAAAALGVSTAYVTGTILGGVLGRLLPAALVPPHGWATAWLALAAWHAVAALLAAALYPRAAAPQAPGPRPPATAGQPSGEPLAVVYAGGFALLFSQMAVFTYVAFRLAQPPFGWDTPALGRLYLVFLPSLLCLQAARHVLPRFGEWRAAGCAALTGWAGLALTLAGGAGTVVAGLVIFSLAVFFTQVLLANALGRAPARSRARASGGYLFCYYLGGSLGAVLPASAWTRLGWPGCLLAVALVQFGAWLFALAIRRVSPRARAA